MTQICFKESFN